MRMKKYSRLSLLLSLLFVACNPLGDSDSSKVPLDFHPGASGAASDTTSPSVSFSNGTGSSIPSSVTLTFSEGVYGLSTGAVSLSTSTLCAATISSVTFSAGASTATVNLGGTLNRLGDICTLTIDSSQVKDAANNLLTGTASQTLSVDTVTAANQQVNVYASVTNATLTAGATAIDLNSATGFYVGDKVLVIQMQNNVTPALAGTYEIAQISGIAGNQITLSAGLANAYVSNTFGTTASKATQVLRLPRFTNFSIASGGSVVAPAWDGSTGGIAAVNASGAVTIAGSINVDAKGFRGGTTTANLACGAMPSVSATAGESVAGTGSATTAANQSGGGAGNSGQCGFGGYIGAAGGGGGGYGSAGEDRSAFTSGTTVVQGTGGPVTGVATLARILLGSGGGAGGSHDAGVAGAGGIGGGAVILFGNSISVTGSISATGAAGTGCTSPDGSGGGGAGGSIYLNATNAATVGTNLVTALGGARGLCTDAQPNPDYRTGGAGGEGRIKIVGGSVSGTTNPVSP